MSIPETCDECKLIENVTPAFACSASKGSGKNGEHNYVPGPDCPYRRIDEKDARIAALEDALDSIGTAALSEAEDRGSFALVERVELMQALRMLKGGEV